MKGTMKQLGGLLGKYLVPQGHRVLLLGVLIALSLALQLLMPQVLRVFIDSVAGAGQADLGQTALLFILMAIAASVVTAYSQYVSEDVGWVATNGLRRDFAKHCLSLEMAFHKAFSSGEMIERVDGDINKLSNFFSSFVMGILVNGLLLIGVLAFLFWEDWRVGFALTVFSLLAMLVLLLLRDIAVPYWTAERRQSGMFYGFLTEHLSGTEDIRASGAVGYVMNRFYTRLRNWLPAVVKASISHNGIWSASIVTFAVGNAIAFGFGAYLWQQGNITIGTVYLIVHYTELLRHPIDEIRTQMQELQRALGSIGRLNNLLVRTPLVADGPGATLNAGPLAVDFAQVSFRYDDEERVLEDITFALEPGRVLGLLGRSGSGKSTLARLLLRLYDPLAGEVKLDGKPLTELHLSELRRKVNMVTQDVQLFEASVRDNLTFFDPAIEDSRISSILVDLGLGAWLARLPHGLDTVIGTSGSGLSAGEAQLLAFARCFLHDPAVVILDEASSRLDPATEQLIEGAITKLLHNRTGVIIAHHLHTVERADDILILEQGHIVEYGSRIALKNDPASRFSTLLAAGLKELLA